MKSPKKEKVDKPASDPVKAEKYEAVKLFSDSAAYTGKGGVRNTYAAGTDVSHFSKDRLKSLVERGLVAKK